MENTRLHSTTTAGLTFEYVLTHDTRELVEFCAWKYPFLSNRELRDSLLELLRNYANELH